MSSSTVIGCGLAMVLAGGVLATAAPVAARDVAAPVPARAISASVPARAETTPVRHTGDAADDPAIWVHRPRTGRSLVIGTDKKGGLEVYNLAGRRLQRFPRDAGNNVDVSRNIVVSVEGPVRRLHVYRVNRADRRLRPLGNLPTPIRATGLCLYRSPASGKLYALYNAGSGVVQQDQLIVRAHGVSATPRRRFDVGSGVEGCVADERTRAFYISEEDAGKVWRYGAEPSSGTARRLVDSPRSGHLAGDAEGIAVAGSHLFVSSQGDDEFAVYGRRSNHYQGRFRVVRGRAADGCSETDGIEAYAGRLGAAYPHGVFICQDGRNTSPGSRGRQDFKIVDLRAVTRAFR